MTKKNCSTCGGIGTVPVLNGGVVQRNDPCPTCACFTASARVLTPSGWVAIASLNRGDRVISMERGQAIEVVVRRRREFAPGRVLEVSLSGRSNPVETTIGHLFLTARGWMRAGKLQPGDQIAGSDQDWLTVKAVSLTDRVEPLHNLYTTGNCRFIVEGCVVNSFGRFRVLRTLSQKLISLLMPPPSVQPQTAPNAVLS